MTQSQVLNLVGFMHDLKELRRSIVIYYFVFSGWSGTLWRLSQYPISSALSLEIRRLTVYVMLDLRIDMIPVNNGAGDEEPLRIDLIMAIFSTTISDINRKHAMFWNSLKPMIN